MGVGLGATMGFINEDNIWVPVTADNPLPTAGGGQGGPVLWDDIEDKPATFAPTIGTTPTTAMAGNTPIPAAATWGNLSGKPAVIAAGADAAAARAAIGAGTGNGTSNLAVATTAPADLAATAAVGTGTTAARADHVHAFPTPAQIGAATPTDVSNAVSAITNITPQEAPEADLQAIIDALVAAGVFTE